MDAAQFFLLRYEPLHGTMTDRVFADLTDAQLRARGAPRSRYVRVGRGLSPAGALGAAGDKPPPYRSTILFEPIDRRPESSVGRVKDERGRVQVRRRPTVSALSGRCPFAEWTITRLSPLLIEPDVRFSRIRLSDGFHTRACTGGLR